MGIRNCTECGNLCLDTPSKLCPQCQQDYFNAEIKVAEYLRTHMNSTLDEVHDATKVAKHIILKMIQEGRIIEGALAYSCETCGASISSGRICIRCQSEVLDSLNSVTKEEPEGRRGMVVTRLVKEY